MRIDSDHPFFTRINIKLARIELELQRAEMRLQHDVVAPHA